MSEYTTNEPKVFEEPLKFFLTFPVGGYFKDPAAIVSFRIYDSQPTDAELSGKSGHVGTAITAWTKEANDPPTFSLTYGAIADPNAGSSNLYERYWIGLNFKWDSGEGEVYQKRSFLLYRPQCIVTQMNVTYDEIVLRMPFLDDLGLGQEDVSGYIADARECILNELTGTTQYSLHHFHDLQRANMALKHKTLALIAMAYASSSADAEKWLSMFRQFNSMYEKDISYAKVGVDTDKDGTWQPGEQIDDTVGRSNIVLR